ncbi:ATP-binding protein [Rhizobium calliandrae]|uniref:ATP-binding protein n=1 Tax=Rhizobium calliandrae TaxID=1312182 RepID=UPI003D80A4B4
MKRSAGAARSHSATQNLWHARNRNAFTKLPRPCHAAQEKPFFSTRRDAGGTGMGLHITRAMLQSHGGSTKLMENDRDGTAFEIAVPIAP